MIAVIKTVHGTYNILGTDGDGFFLQGNLTEEQLRGLVEEAETALAEEDDEEAA